MNFQIFKLDPRLLAAVEAVGFTTPTPIQEQAIPVVLQGRDLMGLAQTGTGKTAAFVLPILHRLMQHAPARKARQPRALIVAPTRELAEQIHEVIRDLGKQTRLHSVTVYGGVSKNRQIEALQRGVDIVVACPGRLLDLTGERSIDLSQVEVLVLDEADRMCDMGFLPDIRRIIKLLPARKQTLFFSATMPDDIRALSESILRDPAVVQIGIIAPAETVSHALYPVTQGLKKDLLLALLEREANGRVLIFTRTKRRARFLARDLEKLKYRVAALQGNMSQNARQSAINGFREGKYDVLVATDIAARGIDVEDIAHVINFDMPDTVDAYTHRIGRTGRAEQSGVAFTMATPEDADMVRDIEKTLQTRIERRNVAGFDYAGFKPQEQFQNRPSQRAAAGGGRNAPGNSTRSRNPRRSYSRSKSAA
ncbi:MAG: DEAD/DEAH box helicase [Anaerolineales bacterium]|nr:DEAD/DEAH box helicase [Anaerolineales bacterium]